MFEIFQHYISSKATLSNEEYNLIKSVCILKKLRKKQYLLQEGDVWKYNAFVCKGCVRSYRLDEKGNEHILNFAQENWWTGDRESLLTANPSKLNIDAIEDSEIILITKDNFERLCTQIPALNSLINNIINKSFITSQERIHAAMSYTAEEKYIAFIEKHADLSVRLPQHMIASYLGITPETLSRVRKEIIKK